MRVCVFASSASDVGNFFVGYVFAIDLLSTFQWLCQNYKEDSNKLFMLFFGFRIWMLMLVYSSVNCQVEYAFFILFIQYVLAQPFVCVESICLVEECQKIFVRFVQQGQIWGMIIGVYFLSVLNMYLRI
eukprot:TRINITY_DN1809_c0_g2_i1.p5 TRINITY_DN1809_c0_g2~~TRINITY_DN1809_c0_g2_i1.p5  ORF type:complete len:129 (+),score=4.55 TRINITY_DN1809_c0_g2_i1:226-612(+)